MLTRRDCSAFDRRAGARFRTRYTEYCNFGFYELFTGLSRRISAVSIMLPIHFAVPIRDARKQKSLWLMTCCQSHHRRAHFSSLISHFQFPTSAHNNDNTKRRLRDMLVENEEVISFAPGSKYDGVITRYTLHLVPWPRTNSPGCVFE